MMTYPPINLYKTKRTSPTQLSMDSGLESLATKLLPIPLNINLPTRKSNHPTPLYFLPWYRDPFSGEIIYIPPPDKDHDQKKRLAKGKSCSDSATR